MAKHLECGCWLTDDMSKVEGVCEAHKAWQMKMSAFAYKTATEREREACARAAECNVSSRLQHVGDDIAKAIRARKD